MAHDFLRFMDFIAFRNDDMVKRFLDNDRIDFLNIYVFSKLWEIIEERYIFFENDSKVIL